MKNLQFLFNFGETLPKVPINELVNWWKFGQDWTKIREFLLIANFDASLIFHKSVYKKTNYLKSISIFDCVSVGLSFYLTWERTQNWYVRITPRSFFCSHSVTETGIVFWPFFATISSTIHIDFVWFSNHVFWTVRSLGTAQRVESAWNNEAASNEKSSTV